MDDPLGGLQISNTSRPPLCIFQAEGFGGLCCC